MRIDLNSDVGELPERIADGTQTDVMSLVTSVNISCGAHAGDDETLLATLESAKKLGLAVGAHPSYPDRAGFGREKMDLPPIQLARELRSQLEHLETFAKKVGVLFTHVKPHGALYNVAAVDEAVAEAVATAVLRFNRNLITVGLASSPGLEVYRRAGLRVAGEAFIDRRYESDGQLRSRKFEGALITDPVQALEQALSIVKTGKVRAFDGTFVPLLAQTLCIHSDTPGAQHLARSVRDGLGKAGVRIESLSPERS